MNSRVQQKINEIKRLNSGSKTGNSVSIAASNPAVDGLSVAIHSKKDADTFLAELKAIRKRSR